MGNARRIINASRDICIVARRQWRKLARPNNKGFPMPRALLFRCRYLPPVLLALLVFSCSFGPRAAIPRQALTIESTAVDLHPGQTAVDRVGELEYRGGLVLDGDKAAFGGLSGLWVSPDGGEMLAVGDEATWVTARLRYDERGRLSGVDQGSIGSLRGRKGERLERKALRDSEALTPAPDGRGFLVAFERTNRIWRYAGAEPPLAATPEPFAVPAGLWRAPSNGGLESLARLADGRLFAVAEELRREGGLAAWIHDGGRWHPLTYPGHADYAPTDATQLPGGDILVLERRFDILRGVGVRVRRIPLAALAPNAQLKGEIVAEFVPPLTRDNFEGIAAREGPDGETLVYLISDDNFNAVQRTLLMMFVLRA